MNGPKEGNHVMDHVRTSRVLAVFTIAYLPLIAVAAPGDVKESFDAPCKYPSGLATDGDAIFVADWRHAVIHELGMDGKPVRSWYAPALNPSGLTIAGDMLVVSDDHTGRIFFTNPKTGVVESTFEAPAESATGLAFAGDTLFILAKGKIYRVMPDDGTILGYYDVPSKAARHMAHDGKYLWVCDRVKDELYMLVPDTGKVIAILAAPGPHAAGIAWHNGQLLNVDFQTRKVYRLAVDDAPHYRLTDKRRARVEFLWALNNYGPAEVTDLKLNVALPMELPSQKLLSKIDFSMAPARTASDKWDQRCALFDIASVPAGTKAALTYGVNAEVSAIRYLLIPDKAGTLDDIPADIRADYTANGSRYRINTPYMRETAKKIVGDEKNTYWIARKVFDHIIGSMEYEMIGGWDVPEVVLKRGSGSCSEYTYAFVALCRAAGLPARYQGSIVVRGDDASIDEAFHRWAQVYLPNYGWVPVDANRGDAKLASDQCRGFGELSNRFLITTQGGGDSEYLSWGYNAHSTYKATGYCKVEQDNFGFWEPLEPTETAAATSASSDSDCKPKAE